MNDDDLSDFTDREHEVARELFAAFKLEVRSSLTVHGEWDALSTISKVAWLFIAREKIVKQKSDNLLP